VEGGGCERARCIEQAARSQHLSWTFQRPQQLKSRGSTERRRVKGDGGKRAGCCWETGVQLVQAHCAHHELISPPQCVSSFSRTAPFIQLLLLQTDLQRANGALYRSGDVVAARVLLKQL
jgi:hypothetical protein